MADKKTPKTDDHHRYYIAVAIGPVNNSVGGTAYKIIEAETDADALKRAGKELPPDDFDVLEVYQLKFLGPVAEAKAEMSPTWILSG